MLVKNLAKRKYSELPAGGLILRRFGINSFVLKITSFPKQTEHPFTNKTYFLSSIEEMDSKFFSNLFENKLAELVINNEKELCRFAHGICNPAATKLHHQALKSFNSAS